MLGEINSDIINTIIQGDTIEEMKRIADGSVDLIVIDPPYNIGKDRRWDKYETVDAYVGFMAGVFTECERVLKDNGSFYWFHNNMIQIRKLMDAIDEQTNFVYKQFIVWNKRFDGVSNKGFLDGFVEVGGLRNYQKMAEYCLFYTFQDDIQNITSNYVSRQLFSPLLQYAQSVRDFIKPKYSRRYMIETIGDGSSQHFLEPNGPQWNLCTEGTYRKLIDVHDIDKMQGFRGYNSLRQEYETLRQEYESLRYTYNNQRTHHSVWNYEVAPKLGHVTPKPVELIENIIRHSSNEGDVVFDGFLGSGTTAVAAINTGRRFIGIEREEEYVNIARERVEQAYAERAKTEVMSND